MIKKAKDDISVYQPNKTEVEGTQDDSCVPKNRQIYQFMKGVQQKSFKEEYLDKKEAINAVYAGIRSTNDLPVDHTFGEHRKGEE